MTEQELFHEIIGALDEELIHPLHVAILRQSCHVAVLQAAPGGNFETCMPLASVQLQMESGRIKDEVRELLAISDRHVRYWYQGEGFDFGLDDPFVE